MKKVNRLWLYIVMLLVLLVALFPVGAQAAAAPSTVSDFRYVRIGADTVQLSWTTQKGVDGYIVYQNVNGTNSYNRLGKNNYNGTFTVKNLLPNTKYKFAIRAYNTVNRREVLSPSYPVLSVETMSPKVSGLTATAGDGISLVKWQESPGASGYYVFYDNGAGWMTYGRTDTATFSANLPDSSDHYTFGVKTYKLINGKRFLSKDLSEISCEVINSPEPVANFTIKSIGAETVQLTWTKQKDAEGYIVYQGIDGSKQYRRLGKNNYNGTFTVKNLIPNKNYRFAIRAFKTVNRKEVLSPSYPVVSVETMAPKVNSLVASAGDGAATLKWQESFGASGYYVFYDSGAGWVTYGRTDTATFSAALPDSSDHYTFGVKTYKIINGKRFISKDLSRISCEVINSPEPVADFTVKSVGAKTVQLTWTKQSDAEGYIVYQGVDNSKKFTRLGKNNYNGTFTVKNLTPNKEYRFAIRAYKTVNRKEVLSPSYPVVTTETMPPTVTDLELTLSAERAYIRWSPADGAEGYYIYYNCGNGWVEYGNTVGTYYRNKYLDGGTHYTFWIKPYKHIDGKMILSRDVATIDGYTAPVIPQYTVAKEDDSYTLNWLAVNGATGYIVYSQIPGSGWVRQGVTDQTTFTFTQENTPELYLAVRAVITVGTDKYISEFQKQYYFDAEPSGTLFSFGDSIANGMGSCLYTYAEMFAEENNLKIYRDARNGAGLSTTIQASHICEMVIRRIQPNSDYTYIMLEGGFNDYFYDCPLGEVTPEGTANFDMSTVCGGLEAAFTHIGRNTPGSKVIFVMIHNPAGRYAQPNGLGLTFSDYADAMETVCDKYGVVVADVRDALNTADVNLSRRYTFHNYEVHPDGDTVHPIEEAYRLFYLPKVKEASATAGPVTVNNYYEEENVVEITTSEVYKATEEPETQ